MDRNRARRKNIQATSFFFLRMNRMPMKMKIRAKINSWMIIGCLCLKQSRCKDNEIPQKNNLMRMIGMATESAVIKNVIVFSSLVTNLSSSRIGYIPYIYMMISPPNRFL